MAAPIDHVVGPVGKGKPRADFDNAKFANLVERSSRFVWERAMPCPCAPVNTQTRQPDPTCADCTGFGWLWYGPANYTADEAITGALTQTHKALIARNSGVVIRGFLKMATMTQTAADRPFGTWIWGETKITVRPENRIGYYDRMFAIDSEIVFSEILTMPAGATLTLRYPAQEAHMVLDDAGNRWLQDTHYLLNAAGNIVFHPTLGPDAETRVSVRYLTYPSWIITSYPHVIRATSVKSKRKGQEPQDLVTEADVKLEYELLGG